MMEFYLTPKVAKFQILATIEFTTKYNVVFGIVKKRL